MRDTRPLGSNTRPVVRLVGGSKWGEGCARVRACVRVCGFHARSLHNPTNPPVRFLVPALTSTLPVRFSSVANSMRRVFTSFCRIACTCHSECHTRTQRHARPVIGIRTSSLTACVCTCLFSCTVCIAVMWATRVPGCLCMDTQRRPPLTTDPFVARPCGPLEVVHDGAVLALATEPEPHLVHLLVGQCGVQQDAVVCQCMCVACARLCDGGSVCVALSKASTLM
jgi:hypothetical protein